MSETAENNRRIAKNTLMLYVRMFITLIVGLYTSRVVLNTLGVEDYGIYNVVGGVVSMSALVTGCIADAINRSVTYELGRGDMNSLKKIFSISINVMLIMSLIIFVLSEIVGIWFMETEMKISADRMMAARWVFHCSLLSFVLGLLKCPYNASIMAHEHMSVYAYMTIFETVMKLVIIYALLVSPFDKLITYAVLMVAVTVLVQLIYWWYCRTRFEECTYHFVFEKKIFRTLFSFAGWRTIGSAAVVLRGSGNSLLLNIFSGGTAVNAAAGVATTLTGVVGSFSGNFMTAINPQVIKDYAAKKYEEMMALMYRGAKFSSFMIMFLSIPVMLNAEYVFTLWLGVVPEHTVAFVRLILIYSFSEVMSRLLITAKLATGKIRNYEIIIGGILLLTLPLSYVALKLGAPVESVYISNIVTSFTATVVRVFMVRGDIPGWSCRKFIVEVYLRVIVVALLSAILPTLVFLAMEYNTWLQLIVSSLVSVFSSSVVILYVGCNKNEREFILVSVKKAIGKLCRRFQL